MFTRPNQRGISLVELIMFIVIVSVSLAGILLVMNVTTKGSADPLIHKQSLAIAESLLEEVELMPFTFCDPNDPSGNAGNPVITTSTASCTAGWSQDVITGPTPSTATRYSVGTPFNNVADYSTFSMTPILDITGAATGLSNYSANVAMTREGTAFLGATNDAALLITVTVTGPDNVPITLEGIRTRYDPNGLP
jgi:MSHA pilin protein MshD